MESILKPRLALTGGSQELGRNYPKEKTVTKLKV